MARLARLAAFAAGGIALGLAAAAFAVAAMFPPERLTPFVRDRLSRHLDAPVALRRAEVSVFPVLAVRLEDVVIGDPRGYRRPAAWPRGGLVGAKRARGSLALLPLLARRIEIANVRLEEVALTAVRNEQGAGNWEELGGASRPGAAPATADFDLDVRRLELAGARVQVYDARDGLYLAARRVDALLSLRRTAGGRDQRARLRLDLAGLGGRTSWPLGDRPIRIEADVESREAGGRWTVHRAALERGRLALSGTGTVSGPERVLAFRLDQSSLPLSDLLELLPSDQVRSLGRLTGDGTIRLAAEAKGPLSRGRTPALRARASLAGGRLSFRDRDVALEDLAFDLSASEHGCDLAKLTGRVGRSTFAVSGLSRGWADPRLRVRLLAAADLADVSRFLPLADSARLAGRARVSVDGAGRAASATASDFGWSGSVDLAGVSASGVGFGRPITGVQGRIGLVPGRAWAKGLAGQVGASDFTIDGTIERPIEWFAAAAGQAESAPREAIARLAVRSRRLDLDQLLPARRGDQPLPPVRAEGTFEVGSLHLRQLDAERARGRFTYGHGVTAVEDFALDAYGGKSSGRAWFDLRDPAVPRYQLDATAEGMDANAVLGAWTGAKNVAFGTLNMTIDLDGSGLTVAEVARGLSVKGLAQVLGGRLAGSRVFAKLAEFTGVDRFRILSFRDLSAPFRVAQGRVIFDPIALSSGETDWLARGSVGLDGTLDFAVAAVVPPSLVPGLPGNLVNSAGALLSDDGRLTLDLRLRGSVKAPRLDWDTQRTASRLLERSGSVVDLIARQLGLSLGDSLARSGSIEERADRIVEQQKERLEEEAEKRSEELATRAIDELTRLFEKKAPPPPPPAAPPDSTSGGASSSAPPPPPEAPPPIPRDSTAAPPDSASAPAPAPAPAPADSVGSAGG
jgi:hypothetical protein